MFSYHEYGYGIVSDFRDLADSFESKISLSGMWHSISISSIENPQPTQRLWQCSQIVLDRNQCSVGTQRSRNQSKGIDLIGIYCSYEISSFQTSLVSYLCRMSENLYGVTIQLWPGHGSQHHWKKKTWSNNTHCFLSTLPAIHLIQYCLLHKQILYDIYFTATSILCTLFTPPLNQALLSHTLHCHVEFDVLWVGKGELDMSGLWGKWLTALRS